ncbi:MAG: universal stress protein [Rickettsiales bacterium]|nr:universal stress protein [Rickettsiales bacterium]
MRHYHNILYVSHGTSDETEGLKQALSLARNNDAKLSVLVISPEFPKEFPEYLKKYEESLLEGVQASIKASKEAVKIDDNAVSIHTELLSDKTPAIKIIQYVLRQGIDLVIKEAEPKNKEKGFKALDMDLLRKCPAPVWLCRPISQSRQDIQVAVAIDPENREQDSEELSKRMLEVSRTLADSCSGELHIVSCWDYIFEEYLLGNAWIKSSDADIAEAVDSAQREHESALDSIIKASGISGDQVIHQLRGKADEQIPLFVEQKKIDILVMGTLARTGIPGFMIGNTAENVVQKLECSLMALKPHGFVSPVKAT